jgi:signal transduction protein with GAF and PtsI domain
VPLIKWVLRNVPLAAASEGAARALEARTADEVREAMLAVVAGHLDVRLIGLRDALPADRGGR